MEILVIDTGKEQINKAEKKGTEEQNIKVIESIKDLVTKANFDCSATGFSLQAMDSCHVALVALLLRAEGFEHFRCYWSISKGMNLNNMPNLLKCSGNDDIITIRADDGSDTVTFMFESPT
ncbi:hypothetical protein ACLB2K_040072 [Fragaria x ananassa]